MAISVRKVYLGLCLVGIVAILPFSRAEASSLVGGPAPSFELQALDGKVYSLAQLRSERAALGEYRPQFGQHFRAGGRLDKLIVFKQQAAFSLAHF